MTNRLSNDRAKYVIEEHVLGDPRRLRIVTIGAGAAGLNMAHHLNLHMKNFEHVIYEKNSDVGGTWFENTLVRLQLYLGIAKREVLTFSDILAVHATFLHTTTSSLGNPIQSGITCKV
jgi:hypothetical protein